jgi:hypothetical protein
MAPASPPADGSTSSDDPVLVSPRATYREVRGEARARFAVASRAHVSIDADKPPASLPSRYHSLWREVCLSVGEIHLRVLTPALLVHYVRAVGILEDQAQRLDSLSPDDETFLDTFSTYTRLTQRCAVVARQINLVSSLTLLRAVSEHEAQLTLGFAGTDQAGVDDLDAWRDEAMSNGHAPV